MAIVGWSCYFSQNCASPIGANWRQLAPRDENQVGANLAPMAMVILFFTQLHIANWRCRQLAPIVGANWRHGGANKRQLAPMIGAKLAPNWRQFGANCASPIYWRQLAPISANWRQSLAPIGAKLAPIGAQDLKFLITVITM